MDNFIRPEDLINKVAAIAYGPVWIGIDLASKPDIGVEYTVQNGKIKEVITGVETTYLDDDKNTD